MCAIIATSNRYRSGEGGNGWHPKSAWHSSASLRQHYLDQVLWVFLPALDRTGNSQPEHFILRRNFGAPQRLRQNGQALKGCQATDTRCHFDSVSNRCRNPSREEWRVFQRLPKPSKLGLSLSGRFRLPPDEVCPLFGRWPGADEACPSFGGLGSGRKSEVCPYLVPGACSGDFWAARCLYQGLASIRGASSGSGESFSGGLRPPLPTRRV